MKDIRDKVIALAIIGGITGGIVSLVLNLIKLIGECSKKHTRQVKGK